MNTTVAQILKAKRDAGGTLHTVRKHDLVYDALRLMAEKGIGAVLVVEGEQLAGIFTERDYARKVFLRDRSSRTTHVEEVMTSKIYYVEPTQTSDICMALMTERRIRHLPVLDQGRLVGLISVGDLVKSVIADQQFMISQLEHYIHGTPTA